MCDGVTLGLKGQCVLSVSEDVFMDMVNGKTNSQKVKCSTVSLKKAFN